MARPHKQTVDYFSHDTDASDGKTLTIIQSKYGNDGYAFWFKLLQLLGKTPGHYYDFNKPADWEFLLAKTHQNDTEKAKDILETLVVLGAIDAELYAHGVIWCQKFVDRVADAYNRTVNGAPKRPGFLVNVEDKGISVPANNIPADRNPEKATEIPQTKLKETKVNKSNYTVIFKLWNSLEIIKHKKLTADIKRAIDRALRDSSLEEVSQAIKNYAEILKGDQYYFKYSWTLKDFLKRGLDKFLDLEIAKRNYGGDRDGTHREHTTKLPPRDKYTKPRPNPKLDKLVEQQRAANSGPGRDESG